MIKISGRLVILHDPGVIPDARPLAPWVVLDLARELLTTGTDEVTVCCRS